MSCRIRSLLVAAMAVAAAVSGAQGGERGVRYAFLVGCSKYRKAEFHTLPYTGNDILGFRDALLATGFDAGHVVVMHDETKDPGRYFPEKAKILRELDLLLDDMRPDDTLVIALSGHGLQFKDDPISYFAPLDGKWSDRSTLIALNGKGGLYERLRQCKAKRKLLIVNACRNDPTVKPDFSANKAELVDEDRDEVPEGIAAIFSCKAGQKSYFDPERKRALFFEHLISAWEGKYAKDGKVTLEHVFDQVQVRTKADVRTIYGEKQHPAVQREYKGEWVVRTVSAAPPSVLKKNDELDLGGGVKLKLVRIDPGKFLMGSPADEADRERMDKGSEFQHEVEITKPYYIGIYTVTQAQYRQVMGEDPKYPNWFSAKGEGAKQVAGMNTDDFPRETVWSEEAMALCKKVSALPTAEGRGWVVDLPTEAEWEYACRAGTKTVFSYGNSLSSEQANFYGPGPFLGARNKKQLGRTAKVGSYAPNEWGLYDRHGNVWQWCKDWYGKDYYNNSPK